jgi:integrase
VLTPTQIKSAIKAAADSGKECQLNDGAGGRGTGSLVLVIRPSTTGVTALWFGKWKAAGKPHKLQLGRFPGMSLADARVRFGADVRDVLAAGGNPRTAARTADAPTVARLFTAYVEDMKAKGRSSWPEVERALLTGRFNAADALGRDTLAGDVTGGDVAALLGKTFKRGSKVMADRLRSYLSAAFRWGSKSTNRYTDKERRDWGVRASPVADVERDTDANGTRERNLSAVELRQVWHGIGGPGFAPQTTAAVRMLICCGQRVRETLRMEASEVDLAARLWEMPAHKTKGGKRPHAVPLPELAAYELAELASSGPVFPGGKGGGEYMTDGGVSRALRRLQVSLGMKPFQTRDLRRTWKSRAKDAGVDRFTRDLIQQHAQNDTGSKHYDRAEYMPEKRAAMDKWNAWMAANVVENQDALPLAA